MGSKGYERQIAELQRQRATQQRRADRTGDKLAKIRK